MKNAISKVRLKNARAENTQPENVQKNPEQPYRKLLVEVCQVKKSAIVVFTPAKKMKVTMTAILIVHQPTPEKPATTTKKSDAIKYLDKFSGDDLLVAPSVMGALGNCYAQTGQLDKAAATLLKAADRANSLSISPIFLIQAGQILEKQGKNAEAVEAYKQVKNKYGNSYQAMDIDKYIERASLK